MFHSILNTNPPIKYNTSNYVIHIHQSLKIVKLVILIAVSLSTCSAFGQISTNRSNPMNAKKSKLQFGVNFSPDICYRTLVNTDGSQSSEMIKAFRDTIEAPKFGFTVGMNASYQVKENWSIEAGIHYSNKGFQTQKRHIYYVDPNQPIPDPIYHMKFVDNFHCIDIPLKLNYIRGSQKLRFIGSVGLTSSILVQHKQDMLIFYPDRTDRRESPNQFDYNTFNVSPALSMGIDYRIKQGASLRIEPTFRYNLLNFIDAPLSGRLYSIGLNLGYYWGS
jgi:hypothetical protein